MSDEKKQELKKYHKNYCEAKKQQHKKFLTFFLTYKNELKSLRLW